METITIAESIPVIAPKNSLRGKIVSLYLFPEHYKIYMSIPKFSRSKFLQEALMKYQRENSSTVSAEVV